MDTLNITDYSVQSHYFKRIAEIHPDIKHFAMVRHWEEILSLERSKINYPALFLEVPELSFEDNGGVQCISKNAFLIVTNSEADDWDKENFILSQTQRINKQIIQLLVSDSEAGIFDLSANQINSSPITRASHDNLWGWRTYFQVSEPVENCVDGCKFGECAPHLTAAFSWENNTDGGFTQLQFNNQSIGDAWNYLWEFYIDNTLVASSNEENPSINYAGNIIYVQLTISDESGCTLCASAKFDNRKNCGESVPYKYNPKKLWC